MIIGTLTKLSEGAESVIFLPMSFIIHSCCALSVEVEAGLRPGTMRGMVLVDGLG